MRIIQQVNQIFHQVTSDSVRCGTLTIFAVALGLWIGMMQFFSNHQLLDSR